MCCLGKAIWGVPELPPTYLTALQPLPRTSRPAVSETARPAPGFALWGNSPFLVFSLRNAHVETGRLAWCRVRCAKLIKLICISDLLLTLWLRGVCNELMHQPRVNKLATRRPQHPVQKQQHSAGSSTQNTTQSPRWWTCLQLPGCVLYLLHRCLHLLQGRLQADGGAPALLQFPLGGVPLMRQLRQLGLQGSLRLHHCLQSAANHAQGRQAALSCSDRPGQQPTAAGPTLCVVLSALY